jgi:hypothetical protein
MQQNFQTQGLQRCRDDLNWLNIVAQTIEVYEKAIYIKNQN